MKYYPARAFVLKLKKYGESHLILTLFSLEEGKLFAIAKGVRKPKSPFRGHLQLGNRCDFLLYRGRGLDTVSQALAMESYPHIRENTEAYLYASYFLELADAALAERQPQPELFSLLEQSLLLLRREEKHLLARYYELQLLAIAGYRPDFSRCAQCGGPLAEGFLSPLGGRLLCAQCGGGFRLSPGALYGLRFLLRADIESLFRLKPGGEQRAEMEAATGILLQYHLERKVKSRQVLLDMTRPKTLPAVPDRNQG